MENKKTKIGIIILILLIIGLIVASYFYNDFNIKQMALLSEEANKILEADLTQYNIEFEIQTEGEYAKIENAVKEHISNLKNIYTEMEELISGINPNSIFSVQNMQEEDLSEIDNIINDYKEKSQNLISEYEELSSEEEISKKIENVNFLIRKEYYTNLYNEIMLGDVMKSQYNKLDEEIKNEKGALYEKLNKIEKIKTFFLDNKDYWTIKEDKIQITNITKMTEYYNLLSQITD